MKLEGKSLKWNFIRYVVPAIGSQWIFSLYTMIDGLFVAWGVSETALAAVNLSSPFVTGMFAISLTFAVGTSTIVALLFGQKKHQKANEVFSQNMAVLTIVGLLISGLVLLNLDEFCRFLGATPNLMPYVRQYIGMIALFAVCFILSYSFEILLSTDGYPMLAVIIVSVGSISNCILDYLFIIVLQKGVLGAAFATGMSQVIVISIYLRHFLKKKGMIRFTKFAFDGKLIVREVKNGMSAGITELSAGITTFIFNRVIIRYLTEDALVAYSIIAYINTLAVVSMDGIAHGSQPLISYYFGKKEPEKYKKLFCYELAAVAVTSIVGCALCIAGADGIVSLFISQELTELRNYSALALKIFSVSVLIVGYNVIIAGYLTAQEKSGKAILISVGRAVVMLIASMAVLILLFGREGIWWSPTLSEILCLIMAIILLKKSWRDSSLDVTVES